MFHGYNEKISVRNLVLLARFYEHVLRSAGMLWGRGEGDDDDDDDNEEEKEEERRMTNRRGGSTRRSSTASGSRSR